ncbi:MAG: flagellar biosynthesis regulator FlaF [Bosea sp. (in: a-proteobacteria)]
MQQVANAYARVAQTTQSPRELESSILLKAGMKLQAVKDRWPESENDIDAALTYNRKLWTILVSSVTREESQLPREIKQNIVNLGLFIFKHTFALTIEPDPARLQVLININREIAAGLRGRNVEGEAPPPSAA